MTYFIQNSLNQNLSFDLKLKNDNGTCFENPPFFDIEVFFENNIKIINIKLFLSYVYLTLDTLISTQNEKYYSLKFDTTKEPIKFHMEENIYSIINGEKYLLKFYNNELVLVEENYERFEDFEWSFIHMYQEVNFNHTNYSPGQINQDISTVLNDFIFKRMTDNYFSNEIDYSLDDILGVLFIYHNCRPYSLINGGNENLPIEIKNLINKLSLYKIPRIGGDEMFITKIKTHVKRYSIMDAAQKLGYYTHHDETNDWLNMEIKRYLAKIIFIIYGFEEQVGPLEVFTDIDQFDNITEHYEKIANAFRLAVGLYLSNFEIQVRVSEMN